jgi:glyoxylase-like metal-dependent hydrolase (beta-lactamase superfamily II)
MKSQSRLWILALALSAFAPAAFAATAAPAAGAAPAAAAAPPRNDNKIEEVPGASGVYVLNHNDIWKAPFIVSNDGIILMDPINVNAATWFKAEAKKRWNKEVRYLVNSHGHWDHAIGGEVFDRALVVAHDRFYEENQKETIGPRARKPDLTYSEHMTITHGGETVELFHFGEDHSFAMT